MWTMVGALALAACEAEGIAAPVPTPTLDIEPSVVARPPDVAIEPTVLVTRRMRHGSLQLTADPDGTGQLWLLSDGAEPTPLPCDDTLLGAWGLWLDDVDDDGRAEAIVALHKPARFDPAPANRLHVYGFEHGRCVPAWRGTRLAGRFDAATTDPDDRGALWVHEWLSPERHRVARYRWQGFGYAVEHVPWEGQGDPPASLLAGLDFGPSPVVSPPKDP